MGARGARPATSAAGRRAGSAVAAARCRARRRRACSTRRCRPSCSTPTARRSRCRAAASRRPPPAGLWCAALPGGGGPLGGVERAVGPRPALVGPPAPARAVAGGRRSGPASPASWCSSAAAPRSRRSTTDPRRGRGDRVGSQRSMATGRARPRQVTSSPALRGWYLSNTSVRARSSSSDRRSPARVAAYVDVAHRARSPRFGLQVAYPVGGVARAREQVERVAVAGVPDLDLVVVAR